MENFIPLLKWCKYDFSINTCFFIDIITVLGGKKSLKRLTKLAMTAKSFKRSCNTQHVLYVCAHF